MSCAGCESCGAGLYQVHVTLGRHPGSKLQLKGDPDLKVHVIVNMLPSGGWRKEWITTTNINGSERDAVVHMKDVAQAAAKLKIPVIRQKIEVPSFKLPKGRRTLYVEAHVKVPLSAPNLQFAIDEALNVSVNAEKPGNMILTCRRETLEECAEAIGALRKDYEFGPKVMFETAIIDDNEAADKDWMRPWRTS